jgi:hypothetical protein
MSRNLGPNGRCVEQVGVKKYQIETRKSPPFPANECPGQTMSARDGSLWVSTPDKNNVHRWKKIGDAAAGSGSSSGRSSSVSSTTKAAAPLKHTRPISRHLPQAPLQNKSTKDSPGGLGDLGGFGEHKEHRAISRHTATAVAGGATKDVASGSSCNPFQQAAAKYGRAAAPARPSSMSNTLQAVFTPYVPFVSNDLMQRSHEPRVPAPGRFVESKEDQEAIWDLQDEAAESAAEQALFKEFAGLQLIHPPNLDLDSKIRVRNIDGKVQDPRTKSWLKPGSDRANALIKRMHLYQETQRHLAAVAAGRR